ncbi:MAG TPA: hypothetical protein VGR85_14000 [Candidatus Limnocylindria bacterium]|jgi:hypothetical protein|nr:hypothetical protein [Candidatus Limnocylindria bacterium]
MISPIWTAVTIGLLLIGIRLLQRSTRAPNWLAAVTPDVSLGWTVVAAVIGIGVIAALDATGAFREALGAPETPVLIIAAVLVLQVAVLLSVVVIRRRQARASH